MKEILRSTFGHGEVKAIEELSEKRRNRPEVGAIWKRTARSTESEYMTIRLRFSKEKLTELLKMEENGSGLIEYDLVSFPNKAQEENDRRPAYRIYEELS